MPIKKSLFILVFSVFAISACGPLPQFDATVQSQAKNEKAAHKVAIQRIKNECPYPEEVPPRAEVIENLECKQTIFNEVVMPNAMMPDLWMQLLADLKLNAVKYKEGKLSKDQYKANGEKLYADMFQKMEQRHQQARAQAIQQQQNFAQRMSAAGQSLQQQSAINAGQCSAIDIAPIASPGCKNICINGRWAEVCG